MGTNYLPYNDAEFTNWVVSFVAYLAPHVDEFGLTAADIATLLADKPEWESAFNAHLAAQASARSARQNKDARREALEADIRSLVNRIQAYPGTTDAQREDLGITVRSSIATPTDLEASGDKPVAIIDISGRMKHVLRIQNQTPTGMSRAKPAGALGCEVWRKVGEEPVGDTDLEYVDLVTRSPYVVQYSAEDAGKNAHYMFRWVSAKGEKGTWSETETATIAA